MPLSRPGHGPGIAAFVELVSQDSPNLGYTTTPSADGVVAVSPTLAGEGEQSIDFAKARKRISGEQGWTGTSCCWSWTSF
jgi:hypothetical protein